MSIAKKPYEISLWDEQLVWHRRKLELVNKTEEFTSANPYRRGAYYVESGAQGVTTYELSYEDYDSDKDYFKLAQLSNDNCIESYDSTGLNISESTHSSWYSNGRMVPNIIFSFYKETRLCTIGSDTMDSPARAVNGKLVRKVNGEVTFTFTVYYRYFDNITGQLEYNPFMPYLVNERKVKLKYDGEWYDLIIKQIQENSETKAFTYTCKSQFINELSKTGFELEFDNELENNMGTVDYLADQILEGSDWKRQGNSNLKQFVEEPLYRITLGEEISAMHMEDQAEQKISAGRKIYAFYSQVVDQKEELQFVYIDSDSFDTNGDSTFATNDDLIIDKEQYPNYVVSVDQYDENGWPNFTAYSTEGEKPALAQISTKYRGMRLVRQARTIYDSKIDKFVRIYKKQGDANTVYYGFEETKYLSPNAVTNYIVNPNAFTSTTGWYAQPNAQGARATLELAMNPPFNATNAVPTTNFTSYLSFPNNGGALINSSINSFKSSLEGFVEGETKYILRVKCKSSPSNTTYIEPTTLKIYQYQDMDNFKVMGDPVFEFVKMSSVFPTNEEEQDASFTYYQATCNVSVTKDKLKSWDNHYGLFLTFDSGYNNIYIEDIQLFPQIEYEKEGRTLLCVPGGELFSKIETIQKYYNSSQTYTSIEEIQFEPAGGTYELQYEDGATAFTKISNFTAKESNRFNLLQDLNEKFECWSKFRVDRDETTGEIKYGKDVGKLTGDEAYRQQKFVVINEYAGNPEKNYVGFKYGINSKSIQRTIDSNAITTKMIVKDNANEFAPNGFCSIARANDNTAKENFLLNFDHYYRQQLLNLNTVTNDLYVDANGCLGYYKKLREINRDRDDLVEQQANLLKDIANYGASYQTYKTSYDAAKEERAQMETNICLLIIPTDKRASASSKTFQEIIEAYSSNWTTNSSYIKYTTSWTQCCSVINQHEPLYIKAEQQKTECENRYNTITEILKEKAEQKRALNLQFYKKYSRFIQEGSWIKEDYIDDNLYYLDSMSTLQTSAQPKVTYNISVIDVSPLPGYEDYEFNLGDITYIEDREFFGYSLIDGTTPYREEIVVSEIATELDAPEKNSIKVQNYKTQFEDLFQRITAQTQQAEYHTGEYKRAASVVETDGSISVSTLENSFANNSFKLSNVRDQSVVIDEFGITSTSLANPSEMVRIVNGGIFMSTDGGQNWKTGLTGYGLNSSYLTAGQINTNEIYIMNGNNAAFRWDEKGLAAYYKDQDKDYYNPSKFVRFDHNGIYGILAEDEWTGRDADIHNSASFALTWSGFSLRNSDGSVRISTDNDIQVLQKQEQDSIERIKIGRLDNDTDNSNYGIRIKDGANKTVMETDSAGQLWLRDKLSIGTKNTSSVEIGYLSNTRTGTEKHEVIRAGDSDNDTPFVVYEDGYVLASYIEVKGGKIGNIDVSQIESVGFEVLITSDMGMVVSDGTTVELTAKLFKDGKEYSPSEEEEVSYQWYSNSQLIQGETNQTYEVLVNFDEISYNQYSCTIIVREKGV